MTAEIEIPETLDAARPLLTLWPVGLVPFQIRGQQLALQDAAAAASAAIPVVADYYLGASLDLPAADVPVSESMLDAWGVEMDEVVDAAAANRAGDEATVDQYGAALVVSGVSFAAAVLRRPAALSGLMTAADPVVIVPEPGLVVVGSAGNAASLASAALAAEESLARTDRPVSVTPLVRSGDGWEPFVWPDEVALEARRLRQRWDNVQYAAARPTLQATYQANGQNAFVAEHALAEDADGNRITYATLQELRSVIPRTDLLVVQGDDGRIAQVTFAAVAALGGVLLPAPGTVPEYFAVTRFPRELL